MIPDLQQLLSATGENIVAAQTMINQFMTVGTRKAISQMLFGESRTMTTEEIMAEYDKRLELQESEFRTQMTDQLMTALETLDGQKDGLTPKEQEQAVLVRDLSVFVLTHALKSDATLSDSFPLDITEAHYQTEFLEVVRHTIVGGEGHLYDGIGEQGCASIPSYDLFSEAPGDWSEKIDALSTYTLEYLQGAIGRKAQEASLLVALAKKYSNPSQRKYRKIEEFLTTLDTDMAACTTLDHALAVTQTQFGPDGSFLSLISLIDSDY